MAEDDKFFTVSDSDVGTFMWEPPETVKVLMAGLTPEKTEKVLQQIKNVTFCFVGLIAGVIMRSTQQTTLMANLLTENVGGLEREMESL